MIYLVSPNNDRNFGAALQAYALQCILKTCGYDSQFINLDRNVNSIIKYSKKIKLKNIIKNIFLFIHKRKLKESCEKFDKFVSQHQYTTEIFITYQDLLNNPPISDVYIAGSDQIWTPQYLQPFYFLQFAPEKSKKISYAASLGSNEIPKDKKQEFKKLIRNFDNISTREIEAVNTIQEFTDKNINVNVDPALLLEKNEWEKIETKVGGVEKPYILLYLIYTSPWLTRELIKLRKSTGLDIILVSNTPIKNAYYNKCIRNAGPKEFLWLVHNAEAVISSSYHGNIFSIIYEKPFIAVVNESRPMRIRCLLKMLGLEDRIRKTFDESLFDEVNYEYSKEEIKKEKVKAIDYLIISIEGK